MPIVHRLAVAAVLAALAACAATPAQKAPPAAPKVDDAGINALYSRLDADSTRYENGLALAREGKSDQAEAEVTAALDDLRAAATRCADLDGCDQQRFVAAFDRLLRLSTGSEANKESEESTAGATPEAAQEAGETSPVVAAVPELGRSVTLLKGRELGEIIALNGPVKAALEEWLTQYRPNLVAAYVNYEYMRYLMWPEYQKAGLPEALLFGMLAKESGGKVHAVSRSGASGPLQFMYATGLRFGLGTVDGFDQRFDPKLSARANAAYINEQLAIFNNQLELVIGAYNGGEGAMQRLAGRGGGQNFWDPKIYYAVSQETREYVPMVLAAAWLFMHPERYNLEFPKVAAQPGTITLARPASIAELTICLGNDADSEGGWFRTLRNLNPQLDPQQQEPAGAKISVPVQLEAVYARDCADGKWPTLAAELHSAVVPSPPPGSLVHAQEVKPRGYVVRKGDTLSSIAKKVGCGGVREIAAANNLRAPAYALKPGKTLRIPECAKR
ncbi:MAG TPA: transglycosylase SLT domain-containing protein [Rhodanobacteraceae bacterium]|nr:transglycosylase SLT domain-containing protein [Rhodanobacteraceae bacterium]